MTASSEAVSRWRRNNKRKLISAHGGKCTDCGLAGKPWQMQFDHRDPADKSFGIAAKGTISFERQLEESKKCDLVCANCHANRTHAQRCGGCEDCAPGPT